ncbi:unnamed protein product, partial [Callosobruchus maculatus]
SWPPVPVECALPELSDQRTDLHKTLNYLTTAY